MQNWENLGQLWVKLIKLGKNKVNWGEHEDLGKTRAKNRKAVKFKENPENLCWETFSEPGILGKKCWQVRRCSTILKNCPIGKMVPGHSSLQVFVYLPFQTYLIT